MGRVTMGLVRVASLGGRAAHRVGIFSRGPAGSLSGKRRRGNSPNRIRSSGKRGRNGFDVVAAPPRTRCGPSRARGAERHGLAVRPHAIAAALANPSRRLRRLLLTEEGEAAIGNPRPWPLSAERTDRARLDQCWGARPCIRARRCSPIRWRRPPAVVLERPAPMLVLDQVTDPRNVGAILRSAAAFGAAAVIAQERNAPEETGALAKAASGALERMPLLRAVNIARTLIALKAAGCWWSGSTPAAAAVRAGAGRAPGRAGARQRGRGAAPADARHLRRDRRHRRSRAPVDSLNVSAAASMALYELARRA